MTPGAHGNGDGEIPRRGLLGMTKLNALRERAAERNSRFPTPRSPDGAGRTWGTPGKRTAAPTREMSGHAFKRAVDVEH
jgi:hypothetical protein